LNKWKCNLPNPKQWVDISSIEFSFPTISNVTMNIITTTNDIHTTKAKQNLDATNETTSV
jgi:hypothetical protein